ncbi:hypothetical protein F4819DRAFT_338615 [Hypoxylon fuscum]|nr:hypothetical protein F4819DRAFT_338615 [Hypoxylon fuscum]
MESLPNEIVLLILQDLRPKAPSLDPKPVWDQCLAEFGPRHRENRDEMGRLFQDAWPNDSDSKRRAAGLHGLCQSSKRMYVVVKKFLYENIVVRTGSSMVLLLRTILETPSVVPFIYQISFTLANTEAVVRDAASAWQTKLQPLVHFESLPTRAQDLLKRARLDWRPCKAVKLSPYRLEPWAPMIGLPAARLADQLVDMTGIASVLVSLTTKVDTVLVRLPLQSSPLFKFGIGPLEGIAVRDATHSLFEYPHITNLRVMCGTQDHSRISLQDFCDAEAWYPDADPDNCLAVHLSGFPNLRRLEVCIDEGDVMLQGSQNTLDNLQELIVHGGIHQIHEMCETVLACPNLRSLHLNVSTFGKLISQQERTEYAHCEIFVPDLFDFDNWSQIQSLQLPLAWHSWVPAPLRRSLVASS